jgi:hypothetical protein
MSSAAFYEARRTRSGEAKRVEHLGRSILIHKRFLHFIDSKDRVLIGWNDSYSPPVDRDGLPLVANWRPGKYTLLSRFRAKVRYGNGSGRKPPG